MLLLAEGGTKRGPPVLWITHEIFETLERELNTRFAPNGDTVRAIEAACRTGIAEGWMCNREHAGIRYGRVIKPSDATNGFSVDVVEMNNISGGHHRHRGAGELPWVAVGRPLQEQWCLGLRGL